jgi:hypothetical protein
MRIVPSQILQKIFERPPQRQVHEQKSATHTSPIGLKQPLRTLNYIGRQIHKSSVTCRILIGVSPWGNLGCSSPMYGGIDEGGPIKFGKLLSAPNDSSHFIGSLAWGNPPKLKCVRVVSSISTGVTILEDASWFPANHFACDWWERSWAVGLICTKQWPSIQLQWTKCFSKHIKLEHLLNQIIWCE